jgi:phosphoribosylformylglycinamidine (FGAM) synthase-like amidotransferase family enzyme
MPHPERASEALLGSEDGRFIFKSMINQVHSVSH